ncbi:hypothetical protein MPTK1_7g00350 [Marchantia polymorpha subsp. ruderalis]|uniref:Uncharacterized protein n=2 Tax=Marchantia polymorpha TaxID=3197 RepID=A0AAF6BUP8_MARPO|nr:hypothetical protein MARPO_0046s0089 [Marchantia polymorpha]BBN15732.1 hypothetical protein Mp_7g00350 [Marchantia polymorpha subsp. ruderalis]|eukprot:PTQ39275.1 hypothetical protein MARPO_0046s0089 [Marchantia polymorpha]
MRNPFNHVCQTWDGVLSVLIIAYLGNHQLVSSTSFSGFSCSGDADGGENGDITKDTGLPWSTSGTKGGNQETPHELHYPPRIS